MAARLIFEVGVEGTRRDTKNATTLMKAPDAIVVVLTVTLTIAGANLGVGFGVIQRGANIAVMVWMFIVVLHVRPVAHGTLIQGADQELRTSGGSWRAASWRMT